MKNRRRHSAFYCQAHTFQLLIISMNMNLQPPLYTYIDKPTIYSICKKKKTNARTCTYKTPFYANTIFNVYYGMCELYIKWGLSWTIFLMPRYKYMTKESNIYVFRFIRRSDSKNYDFSSIWGWNISYNMYTYI